jgi:hypothetical protein
MLIIYPFLLPVDGHNAVARDAPQGSRGHLIGLLGIPLIVVGQLIWWCDLTQTNTDGHF